MLTKTKELIENLGFTHGRWSDDEMVVMDKGCVRVVLDFDEQSVEVIKTTGTPGASQREWGATFSELTPAGVVAATIIEAINN